MSIQTYWIKNAITVKEAGFVRSVNEAMANVVFRLEKIEMAERLQRQMNMTSYGPTIKRAHSPDEKIEIETVDKFWKLTLDILKNIPKE